MFGLIVDNFMTFLLAGKIKSLKKTFLTNSRMQNRMLVRVVVVSYQYHFD